MIKLVPDPPKNPLTAFYSFGPCQGDTPVFAVRDGFPVDAMLGNACEYLKSASAIASEVVENSPPHLRALDVRPSTALSWLGRWWRRRWLGCIGLRCSVSRNRANLAYA